MKKIFWIFLLVGIGLLPMATRAQSVSDSSPSDAVVDEVESGDVDGAAQAVSASNLAGPGTLGWFQQSTQALLDRAESLRAQGDYDRSARVARAARRMLTHALKRVGDQATTLERAATYVRMAQISDRLLGDRQAGRRFYRQALKEDPADEASLEALAAYDLEDARIRNFGAAGN